MNENSPAPRPVEPPPFYAPPKPAPKGLLNPQKVKLISFSVISLCIMACALTSILAIWDFTEDDTVWRAFATFLVVAVSTWVFALVNERFGD